MTESSQKTHTFLQNLCTSASHPSETALVNLQKRDARCVWHPYAPINNPAPTYPVKEASGVRLTLADGRQLIDGMSSWWSVIHGYNHPTLNAALQQQTCHMAHVMFGGLTHEPAIQLCEQLVEMTPKPLQKVFLSDSGSVSVEVAMKMAVQYWQSQKQDNKHRFLTLKGGYHGDTFAAMSVCDPVTGMHHLFQPLLMPQVFSEKPRCDFGALWGEEYIADFRAKIEHHHKTIAAVILEPIVQGTGGMHFYSPEFLKRVRDLCDEWDVLLIADEIATGFGRTGKLFACEHADISPDIMCLGKALTGGYMTLAATLCTEKVAQTIDAGEASVLMHGPTFMANPLACSVANASLSLLKQGHWRTQVKNIEHQLQHSLSAARVFPWVKAVRILGAIGVIELHQEVTLSKVTPQFVDAGIWIRPFGRLVYIMPPYVISPSDLDTLVTNLIKVVGSWSDLSPSA